MPEHHYDTPEPIDLVIAIGRGTVRVDATETATTDIVITGKHADQVRVTQSTGAVSITDPRDGLGFRSGDVRADVVVSLPTGSRLVTRLGSADLTVTGSLGESHLKAGSGDVRLDVLSGPTGIETGSGDVRVLGPTDDLRVKSGSGDVTLGRTHGSLTVSTGSGDVSLEDVEGRSVVKTGSGDLLIATARADASYMTGSGDLRIRNALRGSFTARTASGDVAVAVPAGVPVWTDINTLTGQIHSTLQGAGQPEPGQDHVELRVTTASGDVDLQEI
jgi:DUF4097 and DUF4098 domain-containing protein YvlB